MCSQEAPLSYPSLTLPPSHAGSQQLLAALFATQPAAVQQLLKQAQRWVKYQGQAQPPPRPLAGEPNHPWRRIVQVLGAGGVATSSPDTAGKDGEESGGAGR